MSNQTETVERKPLLYTLKETVEFFKERKTVGRMKTEHSIFIPTSLMHEQPKEIKDFIKAATYINSKSEWFLKISVEEVTVGKIAGVEFIFTFTPETKFEEAIRYINGRLRGE